MTGLAYAGLYVVAESWLNDRSTNQNRGRLLAIYMIVSLGGLGLGQLLLNVASPDSVSLFILSSVLVSLALVPVSLSAISAPRFSEPSHIGFGSLFKLSPLGVVGCASVGVVHGAVFGMGAVYAAKAGMSVGETSVFMFIFLAGGIVLQWPLGRLSDTLSRSLVITATTCLAGVLSLVAIAISGRGHEALFLVMCVYGGMSLPLYSICVAYTNDRLTSEQMVAASSTLVLVRGIGSVLGPMATALFMAWFGLTAFFWCLAFAHILVGAFALYRRTQRAAVPVEEQRQYPMTSPQESPIAAAIVAESAKEEDD